MDCRVAGGGGSCDVGEVDLVQSRVTSTADPEPCNTPEIG